MHAAYRVAACRFTMVGQSFLPQVLNHLSAHPQYHRMMPLFWAGAVHNSDRLALRPPSIKDALCETLHYRLPSLGTRDSKSNARCGVSREQGVVVDAKSILLVARSTAPTNCDYPGTLSLAGLEGCSDKSEVRRGRLK